MEDRAIRSDVDTEPAARVERSDVWTARALVRDSLAALTPTERVVALTSVLAECAREIVEPRPVAAVAETHTRDPGPPIRRDLTQKQAAILAWIEAYIERTRFPPTLREIGTAFGIGSTNGVNDHLLALERKGYLERSAGALSRGLRLTGKAVG